MSLPEQMILRITPENSSYTGEVLWRSDLHCNVSLIDRTWIVEEREQKSQFTVGKRPSQNYILTEFTLKAEFHTNNSRNHGVSISTILMNQACIYPIY